MCMVNSIAPSPPHHMCYLCALLCVEICIIFVSYIYARKTPPPAVSASTRCCILYIVYVYAYTICRKKHIQSANHTHTHIQVPSPLAPSSTSAREYPAASSPAASKSRTSPRRIYALLHHHTRCAARRATTYSHHHEVRMFFSTNMRFAC